MSHPSSSFRMASGRQRQKVAKKKLDFCRKKHRFYNKNVK